jgi:hypothetical protein
VFLLRLREALHRRGAGLRHHGISAAGSADPALGEMRQLATQVVMLKRGRVIAFGGAEVLPGAPSPA